jgi:hypothetical protein
MSIASIFFLRIESTWSDLLVFLMIGVLMVFNELVKCERVARYCW